MGVYIKGMEMPKNCGECAFCRAAIWNGKEYPCVCLAKNIVVKPSETDMRDGLCPLLPVPDHGDLIDRSALLARYAEEVKPSNNSDFMRPPRWNDAVQLTEIAPVVIPAERSEE